MKCPNCGKEIAEDSTFCEFCGEKTTNKKSRIVNLLNKKWFPAVAILTIVVIALAAFFITKAIREREYYVDLGLPSGTLWKNRNEDVGRLKFSEALEKYGNELPAKEQIEELINCCQWKWDGEGYEVIGPNGRSIYFPATTTSGSDYENVGIYWSCTPLSENYKHEGWYLYFYPKKVKLSAGHDHHTRSVIRLVK